MDKCHVDTQDFVRQAKNALLFADKGKGARVPLMQVLVEVIEDQMTLIATDSYALGFCHVGCETSGATSFQVSSDDLTDFVKVAGKLTGRLNFGIDDDSVMVAAGLMTFTWRNPGAQFPNWRQLVTDDREAVAEIRLMDFQLARLAKLKGDTTAVRFEFNGDLKALTFTAGSDIDGLIMPVRK